MVLYEETMYIYPQRTRTAFVILPVAIAVTMAIIFASGGYEGWMLMMLLPLFILAIFIPLSVAKLRISLTAERLDIRGGMMRLSVPVSDIKNVSIRERDRRSNDRLWAVYGYGAKYKVARMYITGDADGGLTFELNSGEAFMVSSGRPEAFKAAVTLALGNATGKARN